MKRILLPTDGSDNAKRALDYALNLFNGESIEFLLLQTFDVPVYTTDMPLPVDLAGIREELEETLAQIAGELNKTYADSRFTFTAKVLPGSLVVNIELLAEEAPFDLIVMGTKGATGIAAAIIGSNTADVIEAAIRPVLAVPERTDVHAVPKQILFAADHKGLSSQDIIAPLLHIATRHKAHVHIMNVLDEGKMISVEEAVAGLKLDHMLEKVAHTFHFENSNDKAGAIENYLNTHQIDMLAVVPRKNNFFNAIFHKSVTRKLALHTKVPLLAMHDLGPS